MTTTSRSASKPCSPDHAWKTTEFLDAKPVLNPLGEQVNRGFAAPAPPSDLAENFRHGGWAPFRKRVIAAVEKIHGVESRRASALRCCGCDAHVMSRWLGSENKVKEYRIQSTKCHDRFCVPCANTRSARIRDSLLRHMYQRENMSLITLTLKASDQPLNEVLNRITWAFKRLRAKPLWKKCIKGGAAIIETKLGQGSGAWHAHFHVLAEAGYIDQRKLSALWLSITGDSHIVDIRRVGAKSGAVQYITKYVCKAADHSIVQSEKHLAEAVVAFHGRRLVTTFGTWRGIPLMEKDDDPPESTFTSEWESEGPLDEFISRAAAGDAVASAIMRRLRPHGPGRPPVPDDPPF
jgi:Replication protein